MGFLKDSKRKPNKCSWLTIINELDRESVHVWRLTLSLHVSSQRVHGGKRACLFRFKGAKLGGRSGVQTA
jgi:hypothetical protein